jgi:Ca-activated chloride channel family protein
VILWRDPLYLWICLPAVAVLGGFLLLRLRRRAAVLRAFADAPLVPRLAPDADERRSLRRMLVRVAALALLAVGLAGPKWGFHWQEVHREGIDLIVAVDTSRSMLATDVKPNRLERAKFAIMDLLPLLQGDRIGLVAFAGTAFLECPLTLDYAAFDQSLRAVEVGIIPRGGTAIARAIDTSLEAFDARQGKYEAIILITDGENTEGDVKEAAKRAVDLGVKVFTVGIGTAEGELLSLGKDGFVKDRSGQVVKSRLNEDTLKDIALTTGGAYVQGLGPSLGLDQVFRDHIATMERREVASTLERRYEERFQLPLALALLLLIAEVLIPQRRPADSSRRRWRRRSPAALPRQAAAALILLSLPALVGWLDPPGDRAAEGNSLYASGKYEDAASKYGEGLIDAPASPLLQFNLATALYKQGKYDDAIAALTKVAALGDAQWVAATNYNLGNAHYRLASNAESSDPQVAIKNYEEALACYKRSMVADAADTDAKLNHEFVARKYDEFKKKLEEQKKQQEEQKQKQQEQQKQEQQDQQQDQAEQQPPQDQQQDQQEQNQDQQQQDQQQQQQQAGGEDQQQQQEQQQQQAEQPQQAGEQQQQDQQQAQQQPEQQGGGGAQEQGEQQAPQQAGAAAEGQTSDEAQSPDQKAAHAVLDTARQEELSPEDIDRAVGVAGVGEPVQDW